MKKFYNRESEIKALNNIWQKSKNRARFTYIIGQRRVGKTALINKVFLQPQLNNTYYFYVERKTATVLLTEYRQILSQKIDYVPEFTSFDNFFHFLFNHTVDTPTTIIFDEFQNFQYSDKSVFSTIQKYWDQYQDQSKINLITIGSIYSSMQKIFADDHEPLYGRTTNNLLIRPFQIATIWKILKDHKIDDFSKLLDLYSLLGGVAQYYEHLEINHLFGHSIDYIFKKLFLTPEAPLKNEGKNKIISEFGPDFQTYFSILQAIATQKKVNNHKISKFTGIQENHVSTYIEKLQNKFNLVQKLEPVLSPSAKRNRYQINDPLLSIWFRFIFSNLHLFEIGNTTQMLSLFKQNFNSIKGKHFETLTIKILQTNYKLFPYNTWGGYWDKDMEIDIVAFNHSTKMAMIGECKLSSKAVTTSLANNIDVKASKMLSKLNGYKIKKYIIVGDKIDKRRLKFDGINILDSDDLLKIL